jgi:hypothetical protein
VVGTGDRVLHRLAVVDLGHAGACAQAETLSAGQAQRAVAQGLKDALHGALRGAAIRRLQQGNELFPAEANHRFARAAMVLQQRRGVLQGEVANGVPVQVIDALEVVQVEHHDHQRLAVTTRLRVAALELFFQPVAQRQAGQGVEPCAVRKVGVLQQGQRGDDARLGVLEVVEVGSVARFAVQDAGADAACGLVHLSVIAVEASQRGSIDVRQALAVALHPLVETAAVVRVARQHVVARGRAQHRTAQHQPGPRHVPLRGLVQLGHEVASRAAERSIDHGPPAPGPLPAHHQRRTRPVSMCTN